MRFKNWMVRLKFGKDGLLMDIDPMQVRGRYVNLRQRSNWYILDSARFIPRPAISALNRLMHRLRRFDLIDAGVELRPLEQANSFQLMQDVWAHRDALDQCETYLRIADELKRRGGFKHKKLQISQDSEIIPLIRSCYLDLLQSLDAEGYLPDKKSKFATGGLGRAIVWKDGSLWHEDGATHRLMAANTVGLHKGFPLRIVGVHGDWLADQGIYRWSDLPRLPEALTQLDAVHQCYDSQAARLR